MATDVQNFTKQDQWARIDDVVKNAKHVSLNMDRLRAVAERIPASIASNWISAFRDTEEHYRAAPIVRLDDRDFVQYTFVMGTQGWLIWEWTPERRAQPIDAVIDGVHYIGSFSMAAFHARAARKWQEGSGKNYLDANVLASLTLDDIKEHYTDDNGKLSVMMLERRLENLREVGRVLLADFDGHFINMLKAADGFLFREDGQGLVQLMQTKFPSAWLDWPMAKLPNVLPLGLSELRTRRTFAPEIDRLLNFRDFENIEGGADYYRPWFFVRVGIFDISDEFKRKLRSHELIEEGSAMEQEFRAFTLVALRKLAELTGGWPQALAALEVETHAVAFLHCRRHQVGMTQAELPCAYRDVCKSVNEDNELMDAIWPLVMTNHY